MQCHEVDYEIFGDDMQIVEVELDPAEVVIAEAGAMNYMDDGIGFETRMGDGARPSSGFMDSLLSAGKRALTGESIFMTHFTNNGQGKKRVAFAAPYPGKIIPIDMAEIGQELICQKDAFLCAAFGTTTGIAFQKKLGVGFFGGEGFILQRLHRTGRQFEIDGLRGRGPVPRDPPRAGDRLPPEPAVLASRRPDHARRAPGEQQGRGIGAGRTRRHVRGSLSAAVMPENQNPADRSAGFRHFAGWAMTPSAYQSSRTTVRVLIGSFIAARRRASRAIASDTPSISNMMRPGFTLQAQ
jgi:hypothetical protein